MRVRPTLRRAALLIALVAAACNAPEPSTSAPQSRETFDSVMAAVRGPDPDGLDKLEALADMGRGVASQVSPLVTSAKVEERFTGLFYFSREADKSDIDTIAKGLNDPDIGNRVTAAATLLRLGDRRGVALLDEARSSDKMLSFSKPPQLLRDYATEALKAAAPGDVREARGANGLRGFAAPPRGPLSDVTVTRTGDTIDVKVRMQFRGKGATTGLIEQWVKDAKAVWEGKHFDSCCRVRLDIEAALEGPDRPGFVQVRVDQLPPAARNRAFVRRPSANAREENLGGKGRDGDLEMRIASKDNGYVFAHELGHVLGVADEYHDGPDGYSIPDPVSTNDVLLRGTPGLMWQVVPTGGVYPAVQARHIEAMLKQYNVAPPVAAATTLPPTATPTAAVTATPTSGASATPTPATRTTAPPTTPPPTTAPQTTPPPTLTTPPPMLTTPPPTLTTPPPTLTTQPPMLTTPPPMLTTQPPTPTPSPPPTAAPTPAPTLTTTIAPARDLTGTWRGGIASTGHFQGQVNCRWTGSATLTLTQSGNTLTGQAQFEFNPGQAVLAGAQCSGGPEGYAINGTASSSSVTFTLGGDGSWYGTFRGSFTTDLMSGTFAGSGNDYGTGCFQVSRAGVGALPGCGQ